MTGKHWSISGLSIETGLDRRTVGKIIGEQNIQAAGEVKGAPVYRMRDFLDGWRAGIADKVALPDQEVLMDLLAQACHALHDLAHAAK